MKPLLYRFFFKPNFFFFTFKHRIFWWVNIEHNKGFFKSTTHAGPSHSTTRPWCSMVSLINPFGICRVNKGTVGNNTAPVHPLIKASSNEALLIDTAALASPLTCINYDSHMMRLMTGSHAGRWQNVTVRPPPVLVSQQHPAHMAPRDLSNPGASMFYTVCKHQQLHKNNQASPRCLFFLMRRVLHQHFSKHFSFL